MVRELRRIGYNVLATDISEGTNFLGTFTLRADTVEAIITNPPYSHAAEFIEHALALLPTRRRGLVAMLLRCDFDAAKTRQHLFGECCQFCTKLVLTKRINWFEHRIASPSYNHAWYIWDTKNKRPPTIAYGPTWEISNER